MKIDPSENNEDTLENNPQKLLHNDAFAFQQLAESEKRYALMLTESPFAFAIFKGKNMVVSFANNAIKAFWGKGNDVEGRPFLDVLPEIIDQGFPKLLDKVFTTGVPFYGNEVLVKLLRGSKMEEAYFNYVYQPYLEADKTISGVTVIAHEVTVQAQLNKKIKESEAYFRLITEYMPEKITNATPDGTVIFYNKSWLDYTGVSLDALINKGWGQWIHPDDVAETTERWLKSVATGDDFDMDLRMLDKNGAYRWHTSRARPIKDDAEKIKIWVGFNTDIHDQKQHTEALETAVLNRTKELLAANNDLKRKNKEIRIAKEKLVSHYARSLIEASLDPLITINTEGVITDMNEAFATITGEKREKLLGTDFSSYFTEPEKAREGYKEVFDKGFVKNHGLTLNDNKHIDVLFNGSVYRDDKGNVLGAVVVARDITEQKRIEKELIEAKIAAELATSIAEEQKTKAEAATHRAKNATLIAEKATQTAEKATKVANDAVKAKQQFLSNMSHEIRTPMNAIIGFTKVLLKTELSAKQKEYLTAVKMSGNALIVLINDILDLAKVDSGKMTFEEIPFKMALSISAMLHLFEPKIQEKNLTLIKEYDPKIPEVLLGDPVRLHQIILNLVSNAVKFTNEGHIKVSIKLIKEDDKKATIEFSVADTGIGIEADKMADIFENFQQAAHDTPRLYGGTGLGLAIVKQLVEPQGGVIAVKSKITEGATFSFVLDFKKTNDTAVFEDEFMELDPTIKNIKVLVVEDMPLNQLLMKTILDDFGFERDVAENGKIAIEKLAQKNLYGLTKAYDVILMDLQMPEMNGFEATEYIRKVLKSKIPIIALTADVTTVDLTKCKAVGMNDYIAKPVDERLLYSKIVNFVKKTPLKPSKMDGELGPVIKLRCTNMTYLLQRTKANPELMRAMIDAYLEQTPPLIEAMKQGFENQDWELLHSAVHKMMPSFLIVGMKNDFEDMAKKIMAFAKIQQEADSVADFVRTLGDACTQACEELKEELSKF